MNDKWHHRIMYLTFFSLGIITTALAVSNGLFNLMLYLIISSIVILVLSCTYNWVRGVDYMKENHPEYNGEDFFDEDEWDHYSDLPNPKAYEKKDSTNI